MTADNDRENFPKEAVDNDSKERCPTVTRQASAASVRQTFALSVKARRSWQTCSGTEADGCYSLLASNAFPKSCGEA